MDNLLKTNIYSLALGAKGVGKVDGKVCFVEDALPGEEVLFEVTKDSARYAEGKLKKIITPSPDRIEPECPYYGRCGGCQLQHLSYEKELYYKKMQIDDTIKRIGGKENFESLGIVASDMHYNYRSSLTLHRTDTGYGFFEKEKKHIIRINECPIANRNINDFLKTVHLQDNKKDITLKVDHKGKVWSSLRTGDRFFVDKFKDKFLYFSPKAFSQTNRFISECILDVLDDCMSDLEADTVFFDCFCGTGFFTFLLNAGFSMRIGFDSNRVAIDCAKTTRGTYGYKDMKFYRTDVEENFSNIFTKFKSKNNVVFIDPPRSGAGKEFLNNLKKHEDISRIYYLSCDPGTLARDIKVLAEENKWQLAKAIPFDMFPRTKHIEVLAEFIRN